MLCDLNQKQAAGGFSLSADELLHNTTGGMFQYLGRERQKKMRLFVRSNIFDFIVSEWKEEVPALASLEGQVLSLTWATAEQRRNFLEWLEDRATVFPAERVHEIQGGLFDQGGT
jgi:hypothetical protein